MSGFCMAVPGGNWRLGAGAVNTARAPVPPACAPPDRVLILARPCELPARCRDPLAFEGALPTREDRVKPTSLLLPAWRALAVCAFLCIPAALLGQGVTTAAASGVV